MLNGRSYDDNVKGLKNSLANNHQLQATKQQYVLDGRSYDDNLEGLVRYGRGFISNHQLQATKQQYVLNGRSYDDNLEGLEYAMGVVL